MTDLWVKRVQKRMNGMGGAELFKLKKPELEKYCGKEEGARLASQLTLQRNHAGVNISIIKFLSEDLLLSLIYFWDKLILSTMQHVAFTLHFLNILILTLSLKIFHSVLDRALFRIV